MNTIFSQPDEKYGKGISFFSFLGVAAIKNLTSLMTRVWVDEAKSQD